MDDTCLIIGDVHGHIKRLKALLIQEGLLDEAGKRINDRNASASPRLQPWEEVKLGFLTMEDSQAFGFLQRE